MNQHLPHMIGRYTIQRELGRGGMGVVYQGYDSHLDRPVALKVILDPARSGAEELQRFHLEARATAKLRHAGIVHVHEVGAHQGRPFIVMDYVVGQTLADFLEVAEPSPHRVAEIVRDMALATQHAHEQGVIHRDIKPANVILDLDGQPRLMDFGLARDGTAEQQLTATGQILGTPSYMAPEQAGGERHAQGPLSDVYGLGAVLYCGLTGRPPFQAESPINLIKKVLFDAPDAPRRINPRAPKDLETIALKCLEKEPDARYPSAAALAAELGRYLAGAEIETRAASVGRRPGVLGLAALAALGVAGVSLGYALQPVPTPTPPAKTHASPGRETKTGPPPQVARTPPLPAGLKRVETWWKPTPAQRAWRAQLPLSFENELGMRFVLIPPGKFLMGSPEGEPHRKPDEVQHEVTITRPFHLAATEVTNAQFRRFQARHRAASLNKHGISLDGDRFPANNVSWHHAEAFCAWLTERSQGRVHYRLPTEAEWEYACRAGTTTRWFWGEDLRLAREHSNGQDAATKRAGVGNLKYTTVPGDDGFRGSAPVGSFKPNPFGLFDMAGNLSEWCQDPYREDAYATSGELDPRGPSRGTTRVYRGGGFGHPPPRLRSAKRAGSPPGKGWQLIGFRVVAELRSLPRTAPPGWFRAIPAEARPPLPLPKGVVFGRREKEYLNLRDSSILVWIPPGELTVRGKEGEPAKTRFARGFFMGKHEVTWEQFRRFCGATRQPVPFAALRFEKPGPRPWRAGDRHPAFRISLKLAEDYCLYAGLELPTSAQWEYAALGASGAEFPWGKAPADATRLNLGDAKSPFSRERWSDRYPYTAPVGSFPRGASPFGCLDMAGNQREWTRSAPSRWVLRGGGFRDDARRCRATDRGEPPGRGLNPDAGLRVCLPPR